MTGAVQAAAGAAAGEYALRLTVQHLGGSFFRPSAISPSGAKFKGITLSNFDFVTISPSIGFRFSSESAPDSQSFFSKIVVQGSSGAFLTLTSSSATYSLSGGVIPQWDWTVAGGTPLVWTETGTVFLQMYP